jgi:hypothetical protein
MLLYGRYTCFMHDIGKRGRQGAKKAEGEEKDRILK